MAVTPDPWAKFSSRDPTLPKPAPPPRDWSNAPWGDVATSALKQLGPSYISDMWHALKGIPAAGKDVIGAFEGKPGTSPGARFAVGTARDLIGMPSASYTPQQQEQDARAVVGGLNGYLYNRYTAPGALKTTLATDPGSALMDAQAVASIPEGGEGLAARLPGVAGDIGQSAVRAAKTFNHVTNPVSLAGEGIAAGSRIAQRAVRGGAPLDKTGNFTTRAQAAVAEAFPNGEITPAELANPKFKTVLANTFQAKGINPASVKEAVLSYNDSPTPRAAITGQRPPRAAAPAVGDAIADGKRAIAAKASTISGAPSPDPSALAGALEDAHARSYAAAQQKYDDLRTIPGSFGSSLDPARLNGEIGAELSKAGLPSTPDLLARSASAYPQANKAMDLLHDALVNGNTRLGGEITAPELMEIRSQLTGLRSAADGKDIKAVGSIIDGFHKNIEDAGNAGKFVTPSGVPNPDISAGMQDANASYKAHFDTFGNAKGPSGAIKRAVGVLTSGPSTPDLQMAAQKGLTQKLFSPTEGPATYDALADALGGAGSPGTQVLDDHVRQTILQTGDDGALAAKPAKLRAFLKGPLADVFSPDEQSDLRLAATGQDVLSTRMPYEGPKPTTGDLVGRGLRAGLGAVAGAAGARLLPIAGAIPGVPEIGGMLAGSVAEQTLEPLAVEQQIRHQMRGAPTQGAVFDLSNAGGHEGAKIARALPAINIGEQVAGPDGHRANPFDHPAPDIDLSTIPGPFDEPAQPAPSSTARGGDPWAAYPSDPVQTPGAKAIPDVDLMTAPGPFDQPVPTAHHEDDPWAAYSTEPPADVPSEAAGGRIGRASGGKVEPEIERLVQRLMNLAKVAKQRSNKATEPLLNAPDATVAKALEVAQRAI